MPMFERKRDRMIEYLKAGLVLANDLKYSATGHLIERALDEARTEIVLSFREAQH